MGPDQAEPGRAAIRPVRPGRVHLPDEVGLGRRGRRGGDADRPARAPARGGPRPGRAPGPDRRGRPGRRDDQGQAPNGRRAEGPAGHRVVSIPRVVIAAPGSGDGKTSVVTWRVGEDRIVPMFLHGARTPSPADVAVIEGVMGLFDGASGRGDFASTAHVARLLGAPVVLVVDAAGMSSSAGALLHGFATWDRGTRVGGVIFNKVGSAYHEQLLRDAAQAAGIPVLGAIRRLGQLAVPSRHLGLIPAAELGRDAAAAAGALAAIVAGGGDLGAVLRLARTAGCLPGHADFPAERPVGPAPPPRVAVAGGAAFTFGYA